MVKKTYAAVCITWIALMPLLIHSSDLPILLTWQYEGPDFCGGRITSMAIGPNQQQMFIGSAAGGLWRSGDGGDHFEQVFAKAGAMAIGTVAIHPLAPDEIWIGSGECNPSLYAYPGQGLFVSRDGGKNWQASGLEDSQRIARIRFHPQHADTLWVAALGDVYGDSSQRGIYKSTDGGRTWRQVLMPGVDTGCIDLIVHPKKPNLLWAASWSLRRYTDYFDRDGEKSTIWQSHDGGETWTISHFVTTPYTGRIGLTLANWSGRDVLFACADDQTPRPREGKQFSAEQLARMSCEELLKVPNKIIQALLDSHQVPNAFDAQWVKGMVEQNQMNPKTIADFLIDEEQRRLSDDAIGLTIYRSDDMGLNWQRVNKTLFKEAVFTYGFYFGQVYAMDSLPEQVYILGVPLLHSIDGGKTFANKTPESTKVHRDMHDLWINPNNPAHLLLASDGGLYKSMDQGKKWQPLTMPAISQAYRLAISTLPPYDLYVGLQDNGIFCKSTDPEAPWQQLWGADGTMVIPDPEQNMIFFGGHQHGNLYRFDRQTRQAQTLKPRAASLSTPYRFNWLAPAMLSQHNKNHLYLGANQLLFSLNQGLGWIPISPDLTGYSRSGQSDVPFGTISAIAESTQDPKKIIFGTDSGKLWRTKNSGSDWQEIGQIFPKGRVADLLMPGDKPGELWVILAGLPGEPFSSTLLQSPNNGDDWMEIGVPEAARKGLRKICQDPQSKNLLYLAGDEGVWYSVDRGQNWSAMGSQVLPPILDLAIHPKTGRLYAASHGQGVLSCDPQPLRLKANEAKPNDSGRLRP